MNLKTRIARLEAKAKNQPEKPTVDVSKLSDKALEEILALKDKGLPLSELTPETEAEIKEARL